MNKDDRNQLHSLILKHFNDVELGELCYEISIDPIEAVQGETLNLKVINLIQYIERRGRVSALIAQARRERPSISWPDIVEENPLSTEELQKEAGSGIKMLHELSQQSEVKEAISDYQTDFEATLHSLDMVRHYKLLHDLFQEMEVSYNLIVNNERPRLEEETDNWAGIITTHPVLEGPISDLIEQARVETYAARAGYWLPMLEQGRTAMRAALQEQDLKELDKALRFLYRALDRGLPRVNGHLVDAATDLPFERLIQAMTEIHSRLKTGFSEEVMAQIKISIRALRELNEQLNFLIDHHNDWQRLDDELRRIDSLIGYDISELEMTWPDIQVMANDLFGAKNERWADDLRRSSERLLKSLESKAAPAMVTGRYNVYRMQVSRRFRLVDDQLLKLCEDLRQIGNPLNMLLSTL